MKNISKKKIIYLILFGLFFSLFVTEVILRVREYTFFSLMKHNNISSIKKNGTYSILCLGDSMTAGGNNSYPRQLEQILNKKNKNIKFTVINKGVPGIQSSVILSELEENIQKYNANMVILLINDSNKPGDNLNLKNGNDSHSFFLYIKSLRIYSLFKFFYLDSIKFFKQFNNNKINEDLRISPEKVIQEVKKWLLNINDIDKDEAQYFTTFSDIGWYYHDRGEIDNALKYFQKEIAANPKSADGYDGMGWYYFTMANYEQAIKMFYKAIIFDSKNDGTYVGLGHCFRNIGRLNEAETNYKKSISNNPLNDWAYAGLGNIYAKMLKTDSAILMYKKSIEIKPDNAFVYDELAVIYQEQGLNDMALQMFNKAVSLEPKNENFQMHLIWFHWKQNNITKAEQLLKSAVKNNPQNQNYHNMLILLYKEKGKSKLTKIHKEKARQIYQNGYGSVTELNLNKIAEITLKKGIVLVCMQYPLQPIEPLKQLFKNKKNIIFIDNQQIFKQALNEFSYNELFADIWGGNFGHGTKKGNEIIANNIADTLWDYILKANNEIH